MKSLKFTLFIIAISTFSLLFFSCSDDDKILKEKDLPQNTLRFIADFFPDNKITYIDYAKHLAVESNAYQITFDDGTIAIFTSDGTWHSISSTRGVPESTYNLLGDKTKELLTQKEPDAKITNLLLLPTGVGEIQIGLKNKKQYLECYGFENRTLGEMLEKEDMPQALIDFLNRNALIDPVIQYSYATRLSESQGDIYQISIGDYNALQLTFDKDGKWIYGNAKNNGAETQLLEQIMVKELPENVILAINNSGITVEHPKILAYYKEGIYAIRFTNNTLLIDGRIGELIPSSTKTANELVKKYWVDSTVDINNPTGSLYLTNPYSCQHVFTYRYQSHLIKLSMNALNNEWTTIYIDKGSMQEITYVELPNKFLNDNLPTAIIEYLNKNYLQPKIYAVAHHNGHYILGVGRDTGTIQEHLYLDEEGNFLKKENPL